LKRKIIKIDQATCNGCGQCVDACHEGAIALVGGKARLVSETYCDGLGACIGECPVGAIKIEEREAPEFNEAAVKKHLSGAHEHHHHHEGHACPGSAMRTMKREHVGKAEKVSSSLGQWPVQMMLVNTKASYFKGSDLLLAADCVPFAYANFHTEMLAGRSIAIGCPKLDDAQLYIEKLTEIIKFNDLKSITVVVMEVPCCSGLVHIAKEAIKASGRTVPLKQITVSLEGDIL
jgi:Fe-S-cluster-containing hydrogenase component 2